MLTCFINQFVFKSVASPERVGDVVVIVSKLRSSENHTSIGGGGGPFH